LLDFSGDLYGKLLRVGFVARLRAEQKFDGIDALKAQIARDVDAGRAALAQCDKSLWAWV
jgi:riboflavin kinase/FMN adenylyltransferase